MNLEFPECHPKRGVPQQTLTQDLILDPKPIRRKSLLGDRRREPYPLLVFCTYQAGHSVNVYGGGCSGPWCSSFSLSLTLCHSDQHVIRTNASLGAFLLTSLSTEANHVGFASGPASGMSFSAQCAWISFPPLGPC